MLHPGSLCLAYHPQHAWVPGVIEDFDGKHASVNVTEPKKEMIKKLKPDDVFICDQAAMEENVDDLLNLSVLHDGTLLTCLRERYFKDVVYTNIGAIVVALNPFNYKIPWYMDDQMGKYLGEGEVIQNNLPHSWAVAHNTYYEMRIDQGNQCILVSGESGAGKTEASKIVMKYLGAVSNLQALTDDDKVAGQQVGQRMMQTNPILEAFGNAKTVRNDNSSRFGKLMQIKFNERGILTGAEITKYLLEKSRIVTASPDERVYHSFYLLLKGRGHGDYGLRPVKEYQTVNSGGCTDVVGVDDGEDYTIVCDAMTSCGVTDEDRRSVWRTLAGVLSLQNVEFEDLDGPDKSKLKEATRPYLEQTAGFWDVDAAVLEKELLTTTLVIQKQHVVRDLNKVKATDARDSLSKATYDHVFSWLVQTINKTINTEDCASWIALLDIFGFEDFKVNSFEQLCINLTNETLQNHYNNYIFIRDMEECKAEGIDTTEIMFPDNKPCLDMIAARGGILALLDEECLLGKATDLTFLDKICDKFGKHQFFERPRLAKVPSFRVHHYAGTVTYEVDGFIEKNRDTLKDAFKLMMRASTDSFRRELLPEPADGSRYTVGGFFKSQLKDLMDLINETNPHWIRCIKPHAAKKPRMFDGVQTLQQLRSSGVLGTVQIRKAGYPIRLKLDDFCRRYRVLVVAVTGVDAGKFRELAEGVLKMAGFDSRLAQVGKSRVFLKSEAYQQLEVLKKKRLQVFASTAVASYHMMLARRRTVVAMKNCSLIKIQAAMRARASQFQWREKDYDARKDVIIAQVRELLEFQQREEAARAEFERGIAETRERLAEAKAEHLKSLEAAWWAGKAERDFLQLRRLEEQEAAVRAELEEQWELDVDDFWADLDDDRAEALVREEEREEMERLEEERRIAEEAEHARLSELKRLQEEAEEAERKREEQRRIALYYWNKQQKERQEEQRRRAAEAAQKTRWMKECADNTTHSLQLMREDPVLRAREKAAYPQPRFSTVGGTLLTQRPPALSGTDKAQSPRTAASPPPATSRALSLSNDAASDMGSARSLGRGSPRGIGGLNPMLINPAVEKRRLQRERVTPDAHGSLQMVQRLRKLQVVRDTGAVRTPVMGADDVRNPMNPASPDWEPPSADVIVLPDGKQLALADCEVPPDQFPRERRRRRRHDATLE